VNQQTNKYANTFVLAGIILFNIGKQTNCTKTITDCHGTGYLVGIFSTVNCHMRTCLFLSVNNNLDVRLLSRNETTRNNDLSNDIIVAEIFNVTGKAPYR